MNIAQNLHSIDAMTDILRGGIGLYSMLFTKALLNGLQYRTRYFISLTAYALFTFVTMSLWVALYATEGDPGAVRTMATFVLLTGSLDCFSLTGVGRMFGKRVLSGDIAMDLLKPYDVRGYFFFQNLGESLYYFLFIILPVMVCMCVIYPPVAPVSVQAGMMSVVLALTGMVISFYFYYLLGLWVFWLKNDWYIHWIGEALMTIFGGRIVPLWLYPDWLAAISRFLPFQYFRYEAIAVYLGQSTAPMTALAVELVWLGLFMCLERAVWKRAQRKIFVLGG